MTYKLYAAKRIEEIHAAQRGCERLQQMLSASPAGCELQSRIDSVTKGVDEAAELVMKTKEYQAFSARFNLLSQILEQVAELLEEKQKREP